MGILRRAFIRTVVPVLWRRDEKIGELLARFSETEADSAWQFLRAVEALPTPVKKAQMFETCIEEMHHAALFERLARSRIASSRSVPATERTVVLSSAADLASFLAYAHVSEDDINKDFGALAGVSSDPKVRAAFEAIQADKSLHEEGAELLLDDLIASPTRKQRAVAAAHLRRTGANLKTLLGRFGDAVSFVLLASVYWLFGWFLVGVCRARLRDTTSGLGAPAGTPPAESVTRP